MRGKFIVFEGGEGSGKTSVSKWVVQQLKAKGEDIVWTREPGGSPFAERIREVLLCDEAAQAHPEILFQLFWLARSDHLSNTVLPALGRGATVISDRFDGSTFAYQIAGQERPELEPLFWRMRAMYVGHHAPDQYLFFDVDPEVGLARAKGRAEKATHFDEQTLEFHQRVRDGYLRFFRSHNAGKTIPSLRIDANASEESVRSRALEAVHWLISN